MARILLVEDDADLSEMVSDWLAYEQHSVDCVNDGVQALERLLGVQYDVAILDWDLPGMSGVKICSAYRAKGGNIPIIMLTGKNLLRDKEEGLDSGADDYLTKPFHMKELSARIRALLRRPSTVMNSNLLKAQDLTLCPTSYRVTKGEAEIQLLPREFALLEFMMRHPGQVFSAEALLDRVWKSDSDASPDALRTCLKRLRKKIDTDEGASIIRTVHGVGYKLEP